MLVAAALFVTWQTSLAPEPTPDLAVAFATTATLPAAGALIVIETLTPPRLMPFAPFRLSLPAIAELLSAAAMVSAPALARTTASPVEICPKQCVRMASVSSIEIVETTELRAESAVLSEARLIVAGGVRLKSKFFQVLRPIAEALGAAIGASRAACVAGFAPFDCQIGQTGKVVTPQLYLAVGISGSVQHLAGIRGAKWIVVINKDPEAPIFRWANYGLVADMFDAVPALVESLSK